MAARQSTRRRWVAPWGTVGLEQVRLLPVGETDKGTVSAAQALRTAIQEMGLAKGEAIVIASRELVEIRTLTVPNVEPDELPEIVRFQSQRQMANVGETWPLDYILLPNDGVEGESGFGGSYLACKRSRD